jgi:DNA-binding response OmpR family regulator
VNSISKVVIIEDDLETRGALSMVFSATWPKVKVLSADVGERGVELVKREKPDIVILDLGLPDISGYEVLKQIRLFSRVPILILTVWTDKDKIIEGLEGGADDYVVKPFRKLEFLSRIEALTKRGPYQASG